jgi:hypothetical protein
VRLDLRVQQLEARVERLALEPAALELEGQCLVARLRVALAVERAQREHQADQQRGAGDPDKTGQAPLVAQDLERIALHGRQVDEKGGHGRGQPDRQHLHQPARQPGH